MVGRFHICIRVDALTHRWPCPKQNKTTANGAGRCVRVREGCGRVLSRSEAIEEGCEGVPGCTGRREPKCEAYWVPARHGTRGKRVLSVVSD